MYGRAARATHAYDMRFGFGFHLVTTACFLSYPRIWAGERADKVSPIAIGGASRNITFAAKSKMKPRWCRHRIWGWSETVSALSLLVGTHQRHKVLV